MLFFYVSCLAGMTFVVSLWADIIWWYIYYYYAVFDSVIFMYLYKNSFTRIFHKTIDQPKLRWIIFMFLFCVCSPCVLHLSMFAYFTSTYVMSICTWKFSLNFMFRVCVCIGVDCFYKLDCCILYMLMLLLPLLTVLHNMTT